MQAKPKSIERPNFSTRNWQSFFPVRPEYAGDEVADVAAPKLGVVVD